MLYTYFSAEEMLEFIAVKDEELNRYFQQVRNAYDNGYYIRERVFHTGILRKKTRTLYTLYWDTGTGTQQVVNFPTDQGPSLNTAVTKGTVMNYFMGLLNGENYFKLKLKNEIHH